MKNLTNQRARLEADPYRRMYEYYVRIPERFYNQTHLEIIRWLLERQEPAHTVGIPIVRTSCDTCSKTYGELYLGPVAAEDHLGFEPLASATERDCAGLAAYPGLLQRGMWMPTNSTGLGGRDDPWEISFLDIPKPSVLFSMIEPASEPIADWISENWALAPSSSGSQRWEVHCTGLAVADKRKEPDPSAIRMNIRRGVELTDADGHFWATTKTTYGGTPEVGIFGLGPGGAAAFLVLFRLTRLPDDDANLLHCTDDTSAYRLFVSAGGDLVLEVDPDGAAPKAVTQPLGLQPGEWACALAVIQAADGSEPGALRLHVLGHDVVEAVVDSWAMSGEETTFSIGGPHDVTETIESDSAPAHHAYLAAWMGPQALGIGDGTLARIWTALDAAYGLDFKSKAGTGHETDQVCWPVGGAPFVDPPDYPDPGILAAKYNHGQFPYAAHGRLHDGAGTVVDVRGFGCSRSVENHARATEDIADDSVWTVVDGEDPVTSFVTVTSPEGLTNATAVSFTAGNTGVIHSSFVVAVGTEPQHVAISCWVRVRSGVPCSTGCELFVRNGEVEPTIKQAHTITGKWKRIVSVLTVPAGQSVDQAGLSFQAQEDLDILEVWGFQFLKEPVLSPYAPNHGTGTAASPAAVLRFDDTDFEGFRDRGFVSLRIKLEELAHLWSEGADAVLVGAYDGDEPANRAELVLRRVGDGEEPTEVELSLATGDWEDKVSVPVNWTDTGVEHHLAVAWDLVRPIAGTDRHLGLWVDGALARNWKEIRPEDPMDLSLAVTDLRIGCDHDGGRQPCAVIREVELLTRHHPGLFTPTRLEERERAEAEVTG